VGSWLMKPHLSTHQDLYHSVKSEWNYRASLGLQDEVEAHMCASSWVADTEHGVLLEKGDGKWTGISRRAHRWEFRSSGDAEDVSMGEPDESVSVMRKDCAGSHGGFEDVTRGWSLATDATHVDAGPQVVEGRHNQMSASEEGKRRMQTLVSSDMGGHVVMQHTGLPVGSEEVDLGTTWYSGPAGWTWTRKSVLVVCLPLHLRR
jgi:hypothetical protein